MLSLIAGWVVTCVLLVERLHLKRSDVQTILYYKNFVVYFTEFSENIKSKTQLLALQEALKDAMKYKPMLNKAIVQCW